MTTRAWLLASATPAFGQGGHDHSGLDGAFGGVRGRYVPMVTILPSSCPIHGRIRPPNAVVRISTTSTMVAMSTPYSATFCPLTAAIHSVARDVLTICVTKHSP